MSRESPILRTLPGPSFANQRSNLSALASSMGSFADTLDVQQRIDRDEQDLVEEARSFLDLQHDRITRVEEDLLRATEHILPLSSNCMTVTELLHLCTSLHRANVELMKRVDNRMHRDYAGYESVLTDERLRTCKMAEENSVEPTTPWQHLVGTSLEQVIEMDNETDATTTPGSSVFFSPPLSAMSTRDTSTPVTPSLASLHLSSSTTAVLRETSYLGYESALDDSSKGIDDTGQPQRHSLDVIETWRARKFSLPTFKSDQTDDAFSSESNADQKPSIGMLGKIEVHRGIDSTSTLLVEETIGRVDPKRAISESQKEDGGNDEIVSNVRQIGVSPLADISSRVRGELSQIQIVPDSTTIVGDDETYRDDDTAAGTIATVLGRGRERRAIQKNQDETYRDDDTAVATITTVLDRGRERLATQQHQDEQPESSNAEEATTDTKLERCNDTDIVDGIAIDSIASVAEKGHKSSEAVEHVHDDGKPAPQTSEMTIVGCDKTHLDDDIITHADATVFGRGRQRLKVLNSEDVNGLSPEPRSKGEGEIYSPSPHTVKEVIVDTSLTPASLDRANSTMDISTMDFSALDMTLASPSRPVIKEGEDETAVESLLVTPVLDRYRLEPDDTSIGVKVVPNERGTHREFPKVKNQLQKYKVARTKMHQAGSWPTPKAATRSNDVIESVSPFVTQRSRTVYRKTPHPKKAGLFHTIDENESPNLSNRSISVERKTAHPDLGTKSCASLRSPFSRVSLPELTHRPYRKSLPTTSRRLSLSEQKPQPERRHTISKVQNSMSRTPLTAAWMAKHMPEDSSLLESLEISQDSFGYDC